MTTAVDTESFARLPDPDRIALLDDQWALVQTGLEPMPTYLHLAAAMGADLDTRAWAQIAAALGSIEYDLRGTASHDAFAAYARSLLQPPFAALGWSEKPGETPDVQELRQSIIGALGNLGDPGVIAEARKRFAAFVGDHAAIPPDAQPAILDIVAQNADAATFEQLHAIARAAKDETELRRYYSALMQVRDPALARQAADVALSPEIPPQAAAIRLILIIELAGENQELSWSVLRENSERLLKPFVMEGPLLLAQYVPAVYWSGVPDAQIETWIRAHVPDEMSSSIERGMETVRFRVAAKARLIRESDAFVADRKT